MCHATAPESYFAAETRSAGLISGGGRCVGCLGILKFNSAWAATPNKLGANFSALYYVLMYVCNYMARNGPWEVRRRQNTKRHSTKLCNKLPRVLGHHKKQSVKCGDLKQTRGACCRSKPNVTAPKGPRPAKTESAASPGGTGRCLE